MAELIDITSGGPYEEPPDYPSDLLDQTVRNGLTVGDLAAARAHRDVDDPGVLRRVLDGLAATWSRG